MTVFLLLFAWTPSVNRWLKLCRRTLAGQAFMGECGWVWMLEISASKGPSAHGTRTGADREVRVSRGAPGGWRWQSWYIVVLPSPALPVG